MKRVQLCTKVIAIVTGFTLLGLVSQAQAESLTLEKIKNDGKLTLGYRESSVPFSYLGGDAKPVGLAIDLCTAVAEKVKSQLDLPNFQIRYIPVNPANRIPLLQNGTIDLECGSTTNTLDRQKQVAFSIPTFVGETTWLALESSGITNTQQLKGKTVVITQGSLSLASGMKLNQDANLGMTIVNAKDQAESLLMLRSGRVAAFFEDNILQAGLVANLGKGVKFTYFANEYATPQYYGLMLRKDDGEFKQLIDNVIKQKMASGEFAALYKKWFEQPIPPRDNNLELPLSEALKGVIADPKDYVTN
ncbi:ABC transporter [Pseudomonas agarici]|uniref:ABC transporter n=1 Tax=Pseudomonas agarici TaxID=46677 RepID=A0A0X1T1K5_PSEAA|nr:amino acid ABC transporter substrate-binding protein [Pseudomonas agarici]AMB85922.1 ABC transporter [Pseudomonas agarici]NWB90687.1 amino acid ABC transporter substrate-binding protein [Pseudomonas agarici]NWC07414.1 amino acid ABC transporter substrate-binding protein [Pseudomonas agarici]SEK45251.1 L-glutamate-binding protein /L-aspartate-binding protein [Pseudomonas agarici]